MRLGIKKVTFFNCYLAVPQPNPGHYQRSSHTNPVSIIAFDVKVTGNLGMTVSGV